MITRREALKTTALAAATLAVGGSFTRLSAQAAGPFTLDPLPYALDALEPHIDAKTMEIHHGRHHAAYVANLNKALADHPALGRKSIDELVRDLNTVPEAIRTAVRNNGGGHANHALFWQCLKKDGGQPKGQLAKVLAKEFTSLDKFKEQFTDAAMKVFGSGWAWLCLDAKRRLHIESTPNQDSPLTQGHTPLLGLDVWEHAYYLKYQNRRAEYVAAFWNVVNWDFVSDRYDALRKQR